MEYKYYFEVNAETDNFFDGIDNREIEDCLKEKYDNQIKFTVKPITKIHGIGDPI